MNRWYSSSWQVNKEKVSLVFFSKAPFPCLHFISGHGLNIHCVIEECQIEHRNVSLPVPYFDRPMEGSFVMCPRKLFLRLHVGMWSSGFATCCVQQIPTMTLERTWSHSTFAFLLWGCASWGISRFTKNIYITKNTFWIIYIFIYVILHM